MARTKKRFRINRIRANHAYTLAELAVVCDVHVRTAQVWKREGMKILGDGKKPIFVMGYHAKTFLKERIAKRKHPAGPGEFFCPRCRCARKSEPSSVKTQSTDRPLGKTALQVIIRGICETCGCNMRRLSSDKKVLDWLNGDVG